MAQIFTEESWMTTIRILFNVELCRPCLFHHRALFFILVWERVMPWERKIKMHMRWEKVCEAGCGKGKKASLIKNLLFNGDYLDWKILEDFSFSAECKACSLTLSLPWLRLNGLLSDFREWESLDQVVNTPSPPLPLSLPPSILPIPPLLSSTYCIYPS